MRRYRKYIATARISLALLCLVCGGGIAATPEKPAEQPATQTENLQLLVTFRQNDSFVPRRAGSGFRTYAGNNYHASPQLRRLAGRIAEKYRLREVSAWSIRALSVYCVVYELADAKQMQQVLSALSTEPLVETAQPMNRFVTQIEQQAGIESYNDPYFKLQYAWHQMGLSQIHRHVTGRNVRLAIIDTSIDDSHPDLRRGITGTESYIPVSQKLLSNRHIHGTAIAGVIIAEAGNRLGMVGVAPDSRVLALEACWYEDAQATHAVCNSFSLAQALGSAIDQDVDIINMSLSGPEDPLLRRLIERALQQNILVIAARGNEVTGDFPASIDGVIAGASAERRADWRQRGHLMLAPGADILSTTVDHGYDFFSGDSIATAQVSGVLALVKQKYKKQETGKLLRDPDGNSAATAANVCELLQAIMPETETSICRYFPHTASINAAD